MRNRQRARKMYKRWTAGVAVAAFASMLVACPSTEERIEQAQQAVPEALARGDRVAARQAVAELGTAVPETPEKLLELATLLRTAGESPRALWLLENGASRYPDEMDVQVALARVALALANPALARSVSQRVPEDAPQHPDALVLEAQAELGLGNLQRALELLKQAERRYPDRPESRLVRIATLTSEKRHAEAAAAIDEALAALGEDHELRRTLELLRAQVQLTQGELDPAIATLRDRVVADPYDLQAWQLLVQGLRARGAADEAIALLEAALAEDARLHALYGLLAPLYAATGREEDVEQALRTFAERSESPAGVEPLVQYLALRGDRDGVEATVRAAVELHPEEGHLRVLLAETLIDKPDLPAARAEAEAYAALPGASGAIQEYLRARFELAEGDAAAAADRLRRIAPRLDLASTHYWLGRAREAQGDLEGARRRYGMAGQRDPRWPAPLAALVALGAQRGDWRDVAGASRALVQRMPANVDAWLSLGQALLRLEDAAGLRDVADRAVAGFPERPEFHVYRAHALRMQGDGAGARAALARAAELERDDPAAAAERAIALAMLGQLQEGEAAARAAADAHPEAARPQAALATLAFARGDGDAGSGLVDRALELAPDDPAPLLDRCRYRAATAAWDGALADCRRYLAARPGDAAAHYVLAASLAGRGDRAEAIAAYREAAELDETDFRAPNNLALLLAESGDLDGALEASQEAYRLSGESPYVADTLGDLYLRKGLVERAISLLEGASAAAPDLPDAKLHLAQAYARAGRTDEARALLQGLEASVPADHVLRPQVQEALDALP